MGHKPHQSEKNIYNKIVQIWSFSSKTNKNVLLCMKNPLINCSGFGEVLSRKIIFIKYLTIWASARRKKLEIA